MTRALLALALALALLAGCGIPDSSAGPCEIPLGTLIQDPGTGLMLSYYGPDDRGVGTWRTLDGVRVIPRDILEVIACGE